MGGVGSAQLAQARSIASVVTVHTSTISPTVGRRPRRPMRPQGDRVRVVRPTRQIHLPLPPLAFDRVARSTRELGPAGGNSPGSVDALPRRAHPGHLVARPARENVAPAGLEFPPDEMDQLDTIGGDVLASSMENLQMSNIGCLCCR
jgi:hypothetical protein